MISVKNLRVERLSDDWDVRVDRSSPLGNKFYMYTESDRNLVCNKYEVWLKDCLKSPNKNVKVIDELKRLKNLYEVHGRLNLFCWCAPKRCHADTIKNILEGGYLCQI